MMYTCAYWKEGTRTLEAVARLAGEADQGRLADKFAFLRARGIALFPQDGSDFFCTTTFPVGDAFCSFVVGGWSGTVGRA